MKNETEARRRQVLGALKGEAKQTQQVSRLLGDRSVRRVLKALARKGLAKREGEDTWSITAEGERALA